MWGYYDYKPKKPQKTKAELSAAVAKMRKKNPDINPVIIDGKLAKTWWGQSWNKNLESYADYSNRIGRGRGYVRSGAVLDLSIRTGEVCALVQGSRKKPYEVIIKIDPLPQKIWHIIVDQCCRKVGNLEELVTGKFPQEFMELFTRKGDGLFPSPKEIHFDCSCPDWASMCKHVAAVLYGIGARFDSDPTLFFALRNIDFTELLKKSLDEKMQNMLKNSGNVTGRVMTDVDTFELFGV